MAQQQTGGGGRLLSLGRATHLAQLTLDTANKTYRVSSSDGVFDRQFWYSSIWLRWRGRISMPASSGPTAVQAMAPYSLIDAIELKGTHQQRGQEVFWLTSGYYARERARIYRGAAPFVLPASLSVTAAADNDIDFIVPLMLIPPRISPRQAAYFALDAPRYSQLDLNVHYGDWKQAFSGGSTAPTVSAYGSATGSPTLDVYAEWALAGAGGWGTFQPGRMFVTEVAYLNSGDIVNGKVKSRVADLPRGYFIRAIDLVTGTAFAATSGNRVMSALSSTIASNIQLHRGLNNPIREYPDFVIAADHVAQKYGIAPSAGVLHLDMAMHGQLGESLSTQALLGGADSQVALYLQADLAAGANQAAHVYVEELRYAPRELFLA